MKKFLLPALLAVATVSTGSANYFLPLETTVKSVTYKLQTQLSTLGWEGAAVTHGHVGTIQFSSGELSVQGERVTGGVVIVDMKTIKATDIKDDETQAKFVGHMGGEDFFMSGQYPTATFKITSVTPIKGAAADANNATLSGDMTIKGITNRISFPAKVGVKNGMAAASGEVVIDRTKYGLKYGSKSFFSSIGDKAINDEFTLKFNVIAKQ